MKKAYVILILILIINKTYAQSFDTLNFIDNVSNYITFLKSANTLKVLHTFKTSKYYSHKIERVFSKGYPEYAMTDEYYSKYKILEVDFITYAEVDSSRNYLQDFVFYFPTKDSSYISDKLTNNGWLKELRYSRNIFSKTINNVNYLIDSQKYPDDKTFRYSITITNESEGNEKTNKKLLEFAQRIEVADSIANSIPIDTIKGVYYAKTEDEIPYNYNGVWEFHKAGRITQRANYKNGLLDGEYITYFKNGLPSSISNYKNGKLNGKWILYYDNGKKAGIRTYNNDIIIDSLLLYYDNGKIMQQSFYKNGKESGLSKMYYQSGKLKCIINHSNNNLKNYSISYWENGQVSKSFFYNDTLSLFQEITFTEKGKMLGKGCYKNGIKDGVWLEYNEEGNISRKKTYKNGRSEEEIEDGIIVEEENGDSYIIKNQ